MTSRRSLGEIPPPRDSVHAHGKKKKKEGEILSPLEPGQGLEGRGKRGGAPPQKKHSDLKKKKGKKEEKTFKIYRRERGGKLLPSQH